MNPQTPNTRLSLVSRLNNARDHEAWNEFIAIYEPLLMRLLRQKGLQDSDAHDVRQQVLEAVAKDITQWRPDGHEQSFRRWLFRIARNRVMKFLTQERKRVRGVGGSDAMAALQQEHDGAASMAEDFQREYREQVLLRAVAQIRSEFHESTWQAFWRSYIEGQPIADVAEQLSISVGSVYAGRSRIVARLRERVHRITDAEE